jgi:hypothetical protein
MSNCPEASGVEVLKQSPAIRFNLFLFEKKKKDFLYYLG